MSETENVAGDELRAFIERIEHVEQEITDLGDGKKEIYAELKGRGYDGAVVREIVKIRKQDPDKRSEKGAILDTYLSALGMMI
jgi:uncharacterized protein (UPF0335 family)